MAAVVTTLVVERVVRCGGEVGWISLKMWLLGCGETSFKSERRYCLDVGGVVCPSISVSVVLTTFTLAWNTPVAIAVLVFSSLHYLCLSMCLPTVGAASQ